MFLFVGSALCIKILIKEIMPQKQLIILTVYTWMHQLFNVFLNKYIGIVTLINHSWAHLHRDTFTTVRFVNVSGPAGTFL